MRSIAPVVAGMYLAPGASVYINDGKAFICSPESRVGIVDPFLLEGAVLGLVKRQVCLDRMAIALCAVDPTDAVLESLASMMICRDVKPAIGEDVWQSPAVNDV